MGAPPPGGGGGGGDGPRIASHPGAIVQQQAEPAAMSSRRNTKQRRCLTRKAVSTPRRHWTGSSGPPLLSPCICGEGRLTLEHVRMYDVSIPTSVPWPSVPPIRLSVAPPMPTRVLLEGTTDNVVVGFESACFRRATDPPVHSQSSPPTTAQDSLVRRAAAAPRGVEPERSREKASSSSRVCVTHIRTPASGQVQAAPPMMPDATTPRLDAVHRAAVSRSTEADHCAAERAGPVGRDVMRVSGGRGRERLDFGMTS